MKNIDLSNEFIENQIDTVHDDNTKDMVKSHDASGNLKVDDDEHEHKQKFSNLVHQFVILF